MIAPAPNARIWLACGHTDMRRGFDGLSSQVQQQLGQDPFICVGLEYVAAQPNGAAIRRYRANPRHIRSARYPSLDVRLEVWPVSLSSNTLGAGWPVRSNKFVRTASCLPIRLSVALLAVSARSVGSSIVLLLRSPRIFEDYVSAKHTVVAGLQVSGRVPPHNHTRHI